MQKIDLFVPGRLCLFGEHSDWAGKYRSMNSALVAGRPSSRERNKVYSQQ